MNKAIKWTLIGGGGLVVLIIAALLIIPMFVDLQKYKPEIEKQVADVTGRPFSIGDDLKLSLFPWAGISFSNLRLGNVAGFADNQFVTIAAFDVRAKLIPLLFGDVQVKRFVVDAPEITLIRKKDGSGNWEFDAAKSGVPSGKDVKQQKGSTGEKSAGESSGKIPLKTLVVGEFAITNGTIDWVDHSTGTRKKVSDVTLKLKDVSFDRPIQMDFSAQTDQKTLALTGQLGPVGKEFMTGPIPLDLTLQALKQIELKLKGKIENLTGDPSFDLDIRLGDFSPRKLLTELDAAEAIRTTDPEVLKTARLSFHLSGSPRSVSLSKGELSLDDSNLLFSMAAKAFSKPDLSFDVTLDQIDLDRYLPPAPPTPKETVGKNGSSASGRDNQKENNSGEVPSAGTQKNEAKQKTDYRPFRKLILNGAAKVGKLKVKNARIQDIKLKVTAKNGVIQAAPLTLALYEGAVAAKATVNVKTDTPKTALSVQADGIQAGPLLRDVADKDFLEGVGKADLSLSLAGDEPQRIKKTLNGRADLTFNDGAIVGIDLAGMVRNAKVAFGLAEAGGPKPRTDFAELAVPITIKNGLVRTTATRMKSPLVRVAAAGKAHLAKETLDFRVTPKFVATIKGQGDSQQRSGIMVPVLISGTFSEPKFRPDLKGLLQQTLTEGVPKLPDLKEAIPDGDQLKQQGETLKDTAKGLLKGLPFGS